MSTSGPANLSSHRHLHSTLERPRASQGRGMAGPVAAAASLLHRQRAAPSGWGWGRMTLRLPPSTQGGFLEEEGRTVQFSHAFVLVEGGSGLVSSLPVLSGAADAEPDLGPGRHPLGRGARSVCSREAFPVTGWHRALRGGSG